MAEADVEIWDDDILAGRAASPDREGPRSLKTTPWPPQIRSGYRRSPARSSLW